MSDDRSGDGRDARPDDGFAGRSDAAIAVDTTVVERSGRWAVEIVVIFPDEAIRRTVNDYPTRRHAEIAAGWIKRAAERDIEGPVNG